MSIETMKQALEALENVKSYDTYDMYGLGSEITALRQAIEQHDKQQAEFNAMVERVQELERQACEIIRGAGEPVACKHKRYSNDVTEDIATCYDCGAEGRMRFVANDTAPPRKKWVGLDDEDWMNVPDFQKEGCELDAAIYDWIEARLKEKNT